MFSRRFKLFTLLGFDVYVDLSWLILALLITWSFAQGFQRYYAHYPGFTPGTFWIMGMFAAAGLFMSIMLHELSHSLVARQYGLSMRGITLFIFGGVAEMTDEPRSPKAEFMMAVAGPVASLAIGAIVYGLALGGDAAGLPLQVTTVLYWLAAVNVVLAIFNMLPAFPLDGGRVLRSALWNWRRNLRWATRIASQIGSGFGIAMIVLGVLLALGGRDVLQGVWYVLIGMFLQNASRASYQHLVTRQTLEGEPVRRFMKTDPVTVPASAPISRFVEDYLYRFYFKIFPVVSNGTLVGCVGPNQVKDVPREEWDRKTVAEIADTCSPLNTVDPNDDATKALALMTRTGKSRLLVVENNRLVGIVTLRDLMRFLSMKLDLEEAA